MKKKTAHKSTKRSSRKVVHHRAPSRSASVYGGWDKDRSMVIMLAAGTIVLVVIGMYMAGWL